MTVSIMVTDPCRLSNGPHEGAEWLVEGDGPGTERPPPGVALCACRKRGDSGGKTAGVQRGRVSKECVVGCDNNNNSVPVTRVRVCARRQRGGVDCEIPNVGHTHNVR